MNKILLALPFLLFLSTRSFADKLEDASYRTLGHIQRSGTVQDASYRTLGHIQRNGTVQDASYRTLGHIQRSGAVQDTRYRTLGYTNGVSSTSVAAYYFFFKARFRAR